ncbi:MAG: PepSY domain-containing protein [Sulfuricella sp.]
MKYFFLMFLALTASPSQAYSFDTESSLSKLILADSGKHARLSLNDATELVQNRTGGRVLAAQEVREQGREKYRVKVLTRQGEVRIVYVDAETGSME